MPTSNGDHVPFGLDQAVPTTARTAWGARLIVDQTGYVDFVPDRQGLAGEDRATFLALLAEQFPVEALRNAVGDLLRTGEMSTRDAKDFTLHQSADLEVHANTNASAGYCYITAWKRGENGTASRQGEGS